MIDYGRDARRQSFLISKGAQEKNDCCIALVNYSRIQQAGATLCAVGREFRDEGYDVLAGISAGRGNGAGLRRGGHTDYEAEVRREPGTGCAGAARAGTPDAGPTAQIPAVFDFSKTDSFVLEHLPSRP